MNTTAQSKPPSAAITALQFMDPVVAEQCRSILCQATQGVDGESLVTLGVASARRGEGVTTIAVHLALQAAQMHGEAVLLVDAQIASPRLHTIFERPLSPGFSEALHDVHAVGASIQGAGRENLMLLPAGEPRQTPERFDAVRAEYLFAELRSEFPLVIVDLPPVAEAGAVLPLAAALDGVLLVVEADASTANAVGDAAELLRRGGARLVGAVMNKCRRLG